MIAQGSPNTASARFWRALFGRSWLAPALIVAAGVTVRLLWLLMRGEVDHATGEAANVAIAFARTGVLADAFREGQGPTAHFMPLSPLIAGYVYDLFGIRSLTSEMILMAVSFALTAAGSLLFFSAFLRAGSSRTACLLGLTGFWLLPINFQLEVVDFRIWEGAMALALSGGAALALVAIGARDGIGLRQIALVSLLAALLFFVSPPLGLGAYAASLVLMVRKLPPARWPMTTVVAVLALALVLTPWVIRNQQVMGEFIPLRSNFGLELAIGNHPAAAQGGDDAAIFRARLREVHPLESEQAFARLQALGGEVAYAKTLGAEAQRWIADNPGAAARLAGKHLIQFLFPPEWFWTIYGEGSKATGLKQAIFWALSIFGFGGALWTLARGGAGFQPLILITVLACLPYIIVQPVPRYRYIIFAPLILFAAYLAVELLRRFAPAGRLIEAVDTA